MIIGLDLSTSCCGWTVLNDDGSYMDMGYIDLSATQDLYEKLDIFGKKFDTIFYSYPLTSKIKIAVEAPFMMFSNASTAHVMSLLQRWNGFVCAFIYTNYSQKPISIPVATARKLCGINVPRTNKKKGIVKADTKEFVLQHVKSLGIIPEAKWGYKKTGTPKNWCFDQADSYVIAAAGLQYKDDDS